MTGADEYPTVEWKCRDRTFSLGKYAIIMGILNVTPDSFSDGGQFLDRDAAVARGLQMIEEGADIIDVGGESTRPGAASVDVREEISRVIPVIEELAGKADALVSVDTNKAEVAGKAIEAGARIINDVSALTGDKMMPSIAAESGAGVVLMHMQGTPGTMQNDPRYGDVVADVQAFLLERLRSVEEQGIAREAVSLDPGIGFGKTLEHNTSLMASVDTLGDMGRPVVIGLSRKSWLEKLTGRAADERLAGSLAGLAFCALHGAHVLRVHDVKESRDALRVLEALVQARGGTDASDTVMVNT
jgi:dihydropteroate synthase